MARMACLLATMAVLVGTPFTSPARAQETLAFPPARSASADSDYNPLPSLPRPPDAPASLLKPGLPLYEAAPLPGPYFERDPLLDPPDLPPPDWFADGDFLVAKAHVKNKLTNANIPGGAPGVVRLPSAPLDWTVAPRFELGKTLPSGFGAFALSYRFLATEGNGAIAGADGPAALKSRLDLNIVDLDYISREISLWPNWDMTWRFGGRTAWLYFDSQADEPFAAAAAGSGVYEQRNSNSFVGFGPHAGLELARRWEGTGLSLFAKTDFWIDLGRIRQGFFEVPTAPGPGQPTIEETRDSSSQAVPALDLEAGLRWQPPSMPAAEFFLGYQYEYWWNAGRLSLTPDSRGELYDQGVQLRAEFSF